MQTLKLENLSIGYFAKSGSKTVLSGINILANQGELIALIGLNGTGKSTLLKTICNLQKSISGHVILNDKSIEEFNRTDLARIISFVSTEIFHIQNLSVFDMVAMGRFPHTGWMGKITDTDREIITNALKDGGLEDFAERQISEISDGEHQRVLIAKSIAQQTPVILLDEPTAFLDVINKIYIINLLQNLTRTQDKTIVFSTHDLPTALQKADKIWLVNDTTIIEGAPEDIILNQDFINAFSSDKIVFDTETYQFQSHNNFKKQVLISGDQQINHLTTKALERINIKAQSIQKNAEIEVIKNGDVLQWKYKSELFSSIYDLVRFLKTEI